MKLEVITYGPLGPCAFLPRLTACIGSPQADAVENLILRQPGVVDHRPGVAVVEKKETCQPIIAAIARPSSSCGGSPVDSVGVTSAQLRPPSCVWSSKASVAG